MKRRSFSDKAQRCSRLDISDDHLSVQIELGLLALVLRMEVRRLMLLVEHPDEDSEERRDNRHVSAAR